MTTASLIEALLFSRTEPWTPSELSRALNLDESIIREGIEMLREQLIERGITLLQSGDSVTLGTHPEASIVLEQLFKEDLSKPLSKASIETLSMIMYGTDVTRGKLDYVRGVNSGFILRSLLVRGLIERNPHPTDKKTFTYTPTINLLTQFGVTKQHDLPDYEKISRELEGAFKGADTTEIGTDSQ
jgi:segregation and condensation protein B